MDKDKIIYGYVDYIIKNSPIDDETFIQNRYDEYSKILGVDDKLRNYFWGVKNVLLTQGFIYFDDNMFFLTEKGQEAKEKGGYFKYLAHKERPLKYQKLALGISSISIVLTILQFTYFRFFDDNPGPLNPKYDRTVLESDSLSERVQTVVLDSLNEVRSNPTFPKKGTTPNK